MSVIPMPNTQLDKIGKMKTAAELGRSDLQWRALVKLLDGLEQNLITPWDMDSWQHCIRGWCNRYGADFAADISDELLGGHEGHYRHDRGKAAAVIRNYLFTGKVDWAVTGE